MGELLLPGPQPPLSHFGATLLRHVVVTGLRYSLYHLGLPLPDKAPTRIEVLRLTLDPALLRRVLPDTAEGRAVHGALIAPEGSATPGERTPAGAAFFHRQRLRWARRRRPPRLEPPSTREVPTRGMPTRGMPTRGMPAQAVQALEYHFRQLLSRALPSLNDAMLDEILTALERRRRRQRGATLAPCLGPQAAAWLEGRKAKLDHLGPPDAFAPSWAEEDPAASRPAAPARTRQQGGRGRFRELYRCTLDGLRPTLQTLGAGALAQGVTGHADDLFFLPFELLGDLTGDEKPPWLESALLRNRAEYFGLLREADAATRQAWADAPLHPLA